MLRTKSSTRRSSNHNISDRGDRNTSSSDITTTNPTADKVNNDNNNENEQLLLLQLHSSTAATASISSGTSSHPSTGSLSQKEHRTRMDDNDETRPPAFVAVPAAATTSTDPTVATADPLNQEKDEVFMTDSALPSSVTAATNLSQFYDGTTSTTATNDEMKPSTSFTSVVSDPPLRSSTSYDTMNTKPHHKRRSNSDIPLSVQTGSFLQQQQQQPPYPYHPAGPPFDFYNQMDNSNRSQQQQYMQQQQQPYLPWHPSSRTKIRNSTTATSNSGSYGNSQVAPPPPAPMYYPYNHPHLPPPPPPNRTKPPSPTMTSTQPPPALSSSPNHRQHQAPQYPYHFNNNYPMPQPSQQPMHYYPQHTGQQQQHPPMLYYPYPPPAPYTNEAMVHQQIQKPPTIQKAASYTGRNNGDSGLFGSNGGGSATTFTSTSSKTPAQSGGGVSLSEPDERQPLLATTVSSSSTTTTTATTKINHPPRAQQQQQTANTAVIGGSNKHHRRSLSSSAAEFGNYGAILMNVNETNGNRSDLILQRQQPQQQQQQLSSRTNTNTSHSQNHVKFSPISEFRKLQKGLSPTAVASRKQAASFSPTISDHPHRLSSSMRDIQYNHNNNSPSPQMHGHPHHHHRLLSHSVPGDGSGSSNNPRFTMLQRGESLRKMHARQQSAQLIVEDIKGTEQPFACRDVFFLLLFVFHLVFMIYLGQQYGPNAFLYRGADTDTITVVYSSLIYIAGWSGMFAVCISALLLGAMTYFAGHFVQIALFFMITLSFIWGTIGIGLSPRTTVPVTGIIALALAVAYTFIVWDRIPFASANLITALSALRDFRGMIYVAFGFQLVALFYSVVYSILVFGIYDAMQDHGPLNLSQQMTYGVYMLLIFSFCWTLEVIQSTVQAITAAVVYKWWHEGRTEANTALVKESCLKTIFYSMGSICFGSLVVTPVRFLRWFFILFRPSSTESSSLMCLHECVHYIQSCVSYCVDSLAGKCNAWAYSYIGMYHYGFLDAGSNATELFEKRGWSTIVSDDLVPNVLFLTSLVIGGVTGCFAYLLSELDRLAVIIPKDDPGLAPFIEGVIIGLVLPSVVFGIISSAVNSVLVCFASSPMDFEIRHQELSHNMRAAWRNVWPRALHVDDAVAMRMVDTNAPFFHPSYQNRVPSPF